MAAKTKSPKSAKTTKAAKALKPPKTKKGIQSKETTEIPVADQSRLDRVLVERAVGALLKYHERESSSGEKAALLGDDQPIQLQFSLLRTPGKKSPKPIQVVIPHPLFKLAAKNNQSDAVEEPEICLIVKEDSKPWCQQMIEAFPEQLGCIKKVLGLQSLRKKHAQYEQRRALLNKYNFFMADDRILPMLTKALGSDFFKAKKLPIPINLTRKEALPFAVQKALSATYMTVSSGTCVTIKAGQTWMTPEQLTENILEITKGAVPRMPHKWANVQNISLKTPSSMALPIYNKTPEALREIAKLAGIVIDAPPKEENEEEPKEAVETKRKAKSALLTALKKQKKEGKSKTKGDNKKPEAKVETDTPKEQETKRKNIESEPAKEKSEEAIETPKGKKKRKSEGGDSASKPKTPDEAIETPKGKKKRKSEGGDSASKPKTPMSKDENDKVSKKDTPKEKVESAKEEKQFVAAKKYKGSKKGYVFRYGDEGLGYYVDVKPKVDRMAIEAIIRSMKKPGRGGQKKGNSNNKGKNKYKGTRRF